MGIFHEINHKSTIQLWGGTFHLWKAPSVDAWLVPRCTTLASAAAAATGPVRLAPQASQVWALAGLSRVHPGIGGAVLSKIQWGRMMTEIWGFHEIFVVVIYGF